MADIYLSEYNISQNINGYNAPHKYRFAKKIGMGHENIINVWNHQKVKVLEELVVQLNKFEEKEFMFATAPSRTSYFVDDINSKINDSFENGIDITKCFVRALGFDAGTTQKILTDNELRRYFKIDSDCFQSFEVNDETPILLLDDVFAKGNTLNGMKLALHDLGVNNEITTAVLLKV